MCIRLFLIIVTGCAWVFSSCGQQPGTNLSPDEKVRKFLEDHRNGWRDLNVPYQDGKALYDLIIKNHYTAALEIGTSTGHSTVWIAWAMRKNGGKLITIEIDKSRHEQVV